MGGHRVAFFSLTQKSVFAFRRQKKRQCTSTVLLVLLVLVLLVYSMNR